MKAYGGIDVQIHTFLTSALVGGKWSASRSDYLTPQQRAPVTHWIEPVWTTWRGENFYPYRDSNSDPSAVQPAASRSTDFAVQETKPVSTSVTHSVYEISK
jgi:hypothetical protein